MNKPLYFQLKLFLFTSTWPTSGRQKQDRIFEKISQVGQLVEEAA
jgi:hypothetical protein